MSFIIRFFSFLPLIMIFNAPLSGQANFDLQGHRGCRGLMPENTVPAFLKATELGVTSIELDIVVNAERKLIVSHEPWMSEKTCSHPDGNPVLKNEASGINIFKMSYSEIQKYDCGKRFHEDFPDQQKMQAVKPTLTMAVKAVEKFAQDNHYNTPNFTIEIKSEPPHYDIFYPTPSVYAGLVVGEIRRLGIEASCTLQSFDVNILEKLNLVSDRKYKIAYLVSKGKNAEKNLDKLSFKPDIYCPKYKLVNQSMIDYCHKKNIRVIPWTVNDKVTFDKLVSMGVDGIITDYPDRIKL